MIVTGDLILGLVLGASLIILSVSIISFRRSGLRGLLFTTVGLILQSALTVALLLINLESDLFAGLDWWVVPVADVLALVLILVITTLRGRAHERSA